MLSTGAPQGCVLSPLLYSLYTYDCTSSHLSSLSLRMTLQIWDLSQEGMNQPTRRRSRNWKCGVDVTTWLWIPTKQKSTILDFRRCSVDLALLYINGDRVERVHTFTFLGAHISDVLCWSANTSEIVKKTHQPPHFLRVLRENNRECKLLVDWWNLTSTGQFFPICHLSGL